MRNQWTLLALFSRLLAPQYDPARACKPTLLAPFSCLPSLPKRGLGVGASH
jgi:hypothetical protein